MDMKKTAVIIAITAALSCTAFANDKLCAVNNTGDKNSAVMVPLRETAEKLGYDVKWDSEKRTAEVIDGSIKAWACADVNKFIGASGYESELKSGAKIENEKMYVPEEFFLLYFFTKDDSGKIVNYEPDNPKVRSEFAALQNGNWIGLTNEQMLEDFDYLYKTLDENYPYFGTLKRMYGVDLKEEYEKSRALISQCKTDAEFYYIIEKFVDTANMVGHLSTITPMEYDWFVEGYNDMEGIPEEEIGKMKQLADTYGNKLSQESYDNMQDIFWPVYDKVQSWYSAEENDTEMTEEKTYSNVETKKIEEGKTAYININSFDMSCYEEDKEKLFAFYNEIKDYENVIFDFTMNGGGGMAYFDDLIVAPNIDKTLSTEAYGLAKAGSLNEKFYNVSEWDDISTMPELPKMNKEDLKCMDSVSPIQYTVESLNNEKMLNGKIWILVSENVFSSSEYAAMFTKATGFATLVGTRTGGDGIGVDPIPVVMPNSGLIVRYSPVYGVSYDGSGSQEFGTEPDIISPDGEDALTTCLKCINNK